MTKCITTASECAGLCTLHYFANDFLLMTVVVV